MSKPNPPGRPPIDGKPKRHVLQTRVSEDELAKIRQAAGEQSVSQWAREVLLRAARRNR